MTIKAILFDVFGTLLDMSNVPRDELRAYGDHLRKFQQTGVYEPLRLPVSWCSISVFADVRDGLYRIGRKFEVFTFSNGPAEITATAIHGGSGLEVPAIAMCLAKGFKPATWVYPWACGKIGFAPSECLMVTANRYFGDLEGAAACGMQTQLIRGDSDVADLIQLAEKLGC